MILLAVITSKLQNTSREMIIMIIIMIIFKADIQRIIVNMFIWSSCSGKWIAWRTITVLILG